jgi:hypothetical protein
MTFTLKIATTVFAEMKGSQPAKNLKADLAH